MSTRFEAGRHNGINASLLKRDRLIRRSRGTNRHDAFRSTLVKDFSRRNSKDETEHWYRFIQEDANLIFKSDGRVWFVFRTRYVQFLEVARQRRDASVESCSI